MTVKVRIPSPLRRFTANQPLVEVEAKDLAHCLEELEKGHPGVKERLLDAKGEVQHKRLTGNIRPLCLIAYRSI